MEFLKRKVLFVTAILGILLCTGCVGTEQISYIDTGMEAVESLEYEEALTSFEQALENQENERLIYRGMGIAYMGLTRYEDAISCLEKALQMNNGSPKDIDYDINYYLAAAYYRNGQADAALRSYDAILALRPREEEAYYLRGCVKLYGGDYEAAKVDFDTVLSLNTGNYDRMIQIYVVLTDSGYREMGSEYLKQAIADNKSISDYDLGRIYYYLEDYENAKACFSRIRTSENYEAALYLGRTYEALGDYNYASSIYSDYTANDQSKAEIYNQLGLCRMQLGEYELALSSFQTGMNIEGNEVMQALKFNEVVAYEYMEEYKTAATLLNDYLKLYPDDAAAAREYRFLKTR